MIFSALRSFFDISRQPNITLIAADDRAKKISYGFYYQQKWRTKLVLVEKTSVLLCAAMFETTANRQLPTIQPPTGELWSAIVNGSSHFTEAVVQILLQSCQRVLNQDVHVAGLPSEVSERVLDQGRWSSARVYTRLASSSAAKCDFLNTVIVRANNYICTKHLCEQIVWFVVGEKPPSVQDLTTLLVKIT